MKSILDSFHSILKDDKENVTLSTNLNRKRIIRFANNLENAALVDEIIDYSVDEEPSIETPPQEEETES